MLCLGWVNFHCWGLQPSVLPCEFSGIRILTPQIIPRGDTRSPLLILALSIEEPHAAHC